MHIAYHTPNMTATMKDTLETYFSAMFPGAVLSIEKGTDKFRITDVDDLRYMRRLVIVATSIIDLAKYIEDNY